MTTDDFTEAAAWQAEEELESYLGTEDAAFGFRDGFIAGARWARTHLSAQETDGERAVREMHHEREWRPLDGTFIGGTVCNACRRPYPCPTISVLDEPARAARRDEGKRS